jgi:hypothetical protein
MEIKRKAASEITCIAHSLLIRRSALFPQAFLSAHSLEKQRFSKKGHSTALGNV